jgi:hypothetical protein
VTFLTALIVALLIAATAPHLSGLDDDLEWANTELARLKAQREKLLARQALLGAEPEVPRFDLAQVEECRRRFAEVFARGTNEEKRAFARLFVKKIDTDPATGEVWMYLFSRPPALTARTRQKRTPASAETGAAIGLVAGAGLAALEKTCTRRWVWELPFERLARALDAMWGEARLRLARVEIPEQRR